MFVTGQSRSFRNIYVVSLAGDLAALAPVPFTSSKTRPRILSYFAHYANAVQSIQMTLTHCFQLFHASR